MRSLAAREKEAPTATPQRCAQVARRQAHRHLGRGTWHSSLTSNLPSPPTFHFRNVPLSMGVCRALGFPGHSTMLNIGHGWVLDGYGGRSVVSAGRPTSTRSQLSFEDPCWLD